MEVGPCDSYVPPTSEHVGCVAHWRFEVAVGATSSYCVEAQVANEAHVRSVVVVGATLWYWDDELHTVLLAHTRLVVAVGAAVSYSDAVHWRTVLH